MLVEELLLGRKISAHELYLILAKTHSGGGLGKSFQAKTRHPKMSIAFVINDSLGTTSIADVVSLHDIAKCYCAGSDNFRLNVDKARLCFALIATQTHDVNFNFVKAALDDLMELYKPDTHKSIVNLIALKLKSLEALLSGSVASHGQVIATGSLFQNSLHAAQEVQVKLTPDSAAVTFIRKEKVNVRVANLEVFSGTMMELFIGPHQPTTKQVGDSAKDLVAILSEKIDFTPFSSDLKSWSTLKFKGAAEIDVACLFMAEGDFHLGNGGIRKDSGLAIRIDFDRTLAPLSLQLLNGHAQLHLKTQRLNGSWHTHRGATALQGFEINSADLTSLPVLKTQFKAGEVAEHYVPANWWLHSSSRPSDAVKFLSQDPDYLKAKFQAILEKIILPAELIHFLADLTLCNLKDKDDVLQFLQLRQDKLIVAAKAVSGYLSFLEQSGEGAKEDIKRRFIQFATKRRDLIDVMSVSYYLGLFDKNYDLYKASSKRGAQEITSPVLANAPPLVIKETVSSEVAAHVVQVKPAVPADKVNDLLDNMVSECAGDVDLYTLKNAHARYLIAQSASLNFEETKQLLSLMHAVQTGSKSDYRFGVIRTGRYLSSGNTRTWNDVMEVTKLHFVRLLELNRVKLSPEQFKEYNVWFEFSKVSYASFWGGRPQENLLETRFGHRIDRSQTIQNSPFCNKVK